VGQSFQLPCSTWALQHRNIWTFEVLPP
jgi:hypothetical protein